jgi:hypothetical protein
VGDAIRRLSRQASESLAGGLRLRFSDDFVFLIAQAMLRKGKNPNGLTEGGSGTHGAALNGG